MNTTVATSTQLVNHLMGFFQERAQQGYDDHMMDLFIWLSSPAPEIHIQVPDMTYGVCTQKIGRRTRKLQYSEISQPFRVHDIYKYSQEELKSYCVHFDLVIYGTKEILRERLLTYWRQRGSEDHGKISTVS